MSENTFSLTPYLNPDTNTFVIKDYDKHLQAVKNYIANMLADSNIVDDATAKDVRSRRTEIRTKKKLITDTRIRISREILGTFEEQLKAFETILDKADKELKVEVDAWAVVKKGESAKTKTITLVVKGIDEKKINQVREYALKRGLTAEIK